MSGRKHPVLIPDLDVNHYVMRHFMPSKTTSSSTHKGLLLEVTCLKCGAKYPMKSIGFNAAKLMAHLKSYHNVEVPNFAQNNKAARSRPGLVALESHRHLVKPVQSHRLNAAVRGGSVGTKAVNGPSVYEL